MLSTNRTQNTCFHRPNIHLDLFYLCLAASIKMSCASTCCTLGLHLFCIFRECVCCIDSDFVANQKPRLHMNCTKLEVTHLTVWQLINNQQWTKSDVYFFLLMHGKQNCKVISNNLILSLLVSLKSFFFLPKKFQSGNHFSVCFI